MATIKQNGTVDPGRCYAEMSGSSLVGSIRTAYADLVATFGDVDYEDGAGAPNVFNGWTLRTPFGPVVVYDFEADVRPVGYRHDEHPDDLLRYSVGGFRENALETFGCVVAALVKAGRRVEVGE